MKPLLSAIALTTFVTAAVSAAESGSTPPATTGPVQLTAAQLDTITAGGGKGQVGDSDPVTAFGAKGSVGDTDPVTLLGGKGKVGDSDPVTAFGSKPGVGSDDGDPGR